MHEHEMILLPLLRASKRQPWACRCARASGLADDSYGARAQFDLHEVGLWPTSEPYVLPTTTFTYTTPASRYVLR